MRSAEQKLIKIKSLLERGELSKAIEAAEELQKGNKASLEIMRITAQLYSERNDLDKLKKQLTYIIEEHPNDTQSLVQLSHLHHIKKELKESLRFIEKAEKTDPLSPQVLNYKSIILNSLFRYDDAMSCLNKIVELGKDDHHTWNNLGLLNQSLGLFSAAEDCFLKSIKKSKNDDSAYNNLIILNHYKPDSPTAEKHRLLVNWQEIYAKKTKAFRHDKELKNANKKIRIGILSDGLFTHPVGQMITTPLESLPYDEMEIFIYSTNLKEDNITKRLKEKSRKWCYIEHLDDLQTAKKIKNDNIEILFDLSGHMSGNRLKVMAMKPAPILVKWVGGLINTTGINTMDYLLSDPVETPVGIDEWYTEKLIRMPHGYVCYEAPSYSHDVYSPPSLYNGHITLGCFNNPQKINHVVLEQWANIMHRLPDSRLFLKSYQFNSPTLVTNVKATMAEFDITEDRLIIEGPSSHSDLLKAYNKVDIALDPWPYSGGLTTCEAMFMGVPVVTYPGPTFAGRHSATHLTNVGLGQLMANSWEEYCDLVVNLANDPDNLANIRKHLRGALLESPLCDAKSFARHFANAMRAIWQRYCEDKEPAALTLNEEGECQFEGEEHPVTLQLPEQPEQSTAQRDNNEFNFNFTGHIIALEHGATLASRPHFRDFLRKGAVNYICLDPGGVIRNAQQLQHTGLFQHFPLTVLGDGSEMELALAVEAERSTTLPIRELDPNAIIPEQKPPVLISTTKVTSNRIDDIDGLDHIDWLILDGQHHNLSILEHGSKKLNNTLVIEVGISFLPSHIEQVGLGSIQNKLMNIGFRLLKLENIKHTSLLPQRASTEDSMINASSAIFIPTEESLKSRDENQLYKLSFLLDSIYNLKGIAYQVINHIDHNKASIYLETEKTARSQSLFQKETIHLDDTSYEMVTMPLKHEIVNNKKEPKVTVICAAYNHGDFIEDAIKGFLAQDTNFDIEIIIHDDFSTDKTTDIIKKYQDLHPELIFPIFQKENQYSKGRKPIDICLPHAKGDYIAFCEGDDFWTDPKKLQNQFVFMEKNKEYSCCYHNSYIFNKEGKVSESKIPFEFRKDYSQEELLLNNCFISTQTLFFRKYFSAMPKEKGNVANGDNFIFSMLGLHGPGKYLENILPTAYRLHENSTWSSKSNDTKSRMLSNTFKWISKYHDRNGRINTAKYYLEKSNKLI